MSTYVCNFEDWKLHKECEIRMAEGVYFRAAVKSQHTSRTYIHVCTYCTLDIIIHMHTMRTLDIIMGCNARWNGC